MSTLQKIVTVWEENITDSEQEGNQSISFEE